MIAGSAKVVWTPVKQCEYAFVLGMTTQTLLQVQRKITEIIAYSSPVYLTSHLCYLQGNGSQMVEHQDTLFE